MNERKKIFRKVDLTQGSILKGILVFALPMFLGQLLQQFYNIADAWVVGNFASNESFAAVSTSGNLIFLITGFCTGLSVGGGVVISRYYGAKDRENTIKAVHNNVLMGLMASALATAVGLILAPQILDLMNIPENVLPESLLYFRIYFGGVVTVVMFNILMGIMRAGSDSVHPLLYLTVSSVVNMILDLILVAGFRLGVLGAGLATVFSQGLSVVLCLIRLLRQNDEMGLDLKQLRFDPRIMGEVLYQGLPTGIQNSVISIGNVVVQSYINGFGEFAMAGQGAYVKIEGFVFLPVMSMSMVLPTFVSQNIGAGNLKRAKKGSLMGILIGVGLAEAVGVIVFFFTEPILRFFIHDPRSISYGMIHGAVQPLFYCLLACSHCTAGVLRGAGKSMVPMFAMLAVWCGFRILYIVTVSRMIGTYAAIAWAYPITWSITTVFFLIFLLTMNWEKLLKKK